MTDALYFDEPGLEAALAERFDAVTADVVRLSAELCSHAGVTVPADRSDFAALTATVEVAASYARRAGLRVIELPPTAGAPYPLLAVGFADNDLDQLDSVVAFIGHLDVVPPREDDQFRPRLEGVDLYARGAADMKTVVASWLVWMARRQADPEASKPPVLVLLSTCEENGSAAPPHTAAALDALALRYGVEVRFAVVGERTGELEWMDSPLIGPICKENRSWRWLRAASSEAVGFGALSAAARVVGQGRRRVAELNAAAVPAEKAARQPGVRSGFVNPFVRVAGSAGPGVVLEAGRAPGAAIHSAAARASDLSLLEQLDAFAGEAQGRFGRGVELLGVEIGADGNFNSYDGSGWLRLRVPAQEQELRAWAAAQEGPLELRVGASAEPTRKTFLGIDIRELMDHREAVDELLAALPAALWPDTTVTRPCARPAWRCPADHPDLRGLEAAWAEVVGSRSPDLVKLHGNDGGSLAERQQRDTAAAAAGLGHAVVFGQVGKRPHGAGEFHRCTSIAPYLEVLDRWLG